MSMKIPGKIADELGDSALFEHLRAKTIETDRRRFRALGPAHTDSFIRHGLSFGQRCRFRYTYEALYAMFLMSYLGSYFHEDFRYRAISACLDPEVPDPLTRTDRARENFILFGEKFIGNRLEIFGTDLRRFTDHILPEIKHLSTDDFLTLLPKSHGERAFFWSHDQRRVLQANLILAQRALDPSQRIHPNILIALGYWLGAGFYKDPLFPWVRDKIKDGSSEFESFALRRLNAQLRDFEVKDVQIPR